jgi:hypothetical protein
MLPSQFGGVSTEKAQQYFEGLPIGEQLVRGVYADPTMLLAGETAPKALAYGPEFAGGVVSTAQKSARTATQAGKAYMEKQATFGYPEETLVGRPIAAAAEEAPKAGEPTVGHWDKMKLMIQHVDEAKPGFAGQLAANRKAVARNVGQVEAKVASGELSGEAAQKALNAARKGKIEVMYNFPPELAFTTEEMAAAQREIAQAGMPSFTFGRTMDAFGKMMTKEHLQPAEIDSLRPFIGAEAGRMLDSVMVEPAKFQLWKEAVDMANLPRTFFASYDISFPLRQGVGLIGEGAWWKSWAPMIKSIRWNAENATALYDDILTDPLWKKYGSSSPIAVSDPIGGAIAKTQEEFAFRDTLANKIAKHFPGIPQAQFAYTTFGNKLRWGVMRKYLVEWERQAAEVPGTGLFDRVTQKLGVSVKGKSVTQDEVNRLAEVINLASGWGSLGRLDKVLPELSIALFSPRFWASQFERVPYGIYAVVRSPRLAKMAARNLGGFIAANMAFLGLVKLSGVGDVEINPLSTDWGRARIGPHRVDLTGGMGKNIRFFAQLATNKAKSASTGDVYTLNRMKTFLREIQGHLSPSFGIGADMFMGQTYVGEAMEYTKAGIKKQVFNRFVPGFVQDTVDAIRASGPFGIPFGMLAGAGATVLTYETPFDKQRALYDTVAKEKGYDSFDDMAEKIGTPKASEIANIDQRVIDLQPEIEEYKTSRGNRVNRSMADVRLPYADAQDTDDKAVVAGTMDRKTWLDNYKERQQNLGSAYAEYLKEHPDMAAKLAQTAKNLDPFNLPTDASPDQVRAAYFKLFDAYKGADGLIEAAEWEKLGPEIDRFRTGLAPLELTSLDENLAAGKSLLVQEYKVDQQKLQPYWDIQDQLWTEFASKNTKLAPFANVPYQDFLTNLGKQYVSEGKTTDYVNTNGYVKAFNKFLDARSQRYILQNPEIDALRNIWGYTEGVHSRQAAQIYEARMGVKPRLIKPS